MVILSHYVQNHTGRKHSVFTLELSVAAVLLRDGGDAAQAHAPADGFFPGGKFFPARRSSTVTILGVGVPDAQDEHGFGGHHQKRCQRAAAFWPLSGVKRRWESTPLSDPGSTFPGPEGIVPALSFHRHKQRSAQIIPQSSCKRHYVFVRAHSCYI